MCVYGCAGLVVGLDQNNMSLDKLSTMGCGHGGERIHGLNRDGCIIDDLNQE